MAEPDFEQTAIVVASLLEPLVAGCGLAIAHVFNQLDEKNVISREEALRSIEALLASLADRKSAMNGLVLEHAAKVLRGEATAGSSKAH